MVSPDTLIQASGLGLSRAGAAIVDDVGFQLARGELVMLVGPNGAGKSTLMNMLAGMLQPDRGTLQFNQQDTRSWQRRDWAQRVTLVPQLSPMNFPLSVSEVVQLGGLAHSDSVVALRTQVQDALRAWDIAYLAGRDVRLLSGGEQQRGLIARALVQQAALIILDEPVNHLDVFYQHQVLSLLRNLAHQTNITVVMSLHDLNLTANYCDEICLLDQGRVHAQGDAETVLKADILQQVFHLPNVVRRDEISNNLRVDFYPLQSSEEPHA